MGLMPEQLAHLVNEGYETFDALTYARHQEGQKEYGTFTFLERNTIEMAMEELADCANYIRYTFVKLHILNTVLSDRLGEQGVGIGPAAFQESKPPLQGD